MQFFLLLLLLVSPIKHVELLNIQIDSSQLNLFTDYSNDNFKQTLKISKNQIDIKTESSNYLHLDLNFRVHPDEIYINSQSKPIQSSIYSLIERSYSLKDYMINISSFLKKNITYSEEKHPQSPDHVILNKKAHCVGFSELTKVLLKGIGINAHFTQGFYLKKQNGSIIPIPHKWIEIELSNGYLYFYDPQYQKFSSNYVVVNNSVIFTEVKKFKIKLINFTKKIID